ncbi:hypothetical protein BC6307_05210 [Sutcliffiella cohnii]|uniref:histidine kinase n=1 Tax=Sutcliffiella cohnii TaxID=33932 RepID=A0A223KMM4_9BACI|nr:ATP-binding protein [Sutcliffiella cohnii]AST90722.1 hypothetical protein BC6307_05210 [Sutcliffiella cohnii]
MLNEYLAKVRHRCIENKLDPKLIPSFTKISWNELNRIRDEYKERLAVIQTFMERFIYRNSGIPVLVTVTDADGNFIDYLGDKSLEETVVHQVGLQMGVQFKEELVGISSIRAAIDLEIPVQLIGTDHYHEFLHQSACYSVPLHVNEKLIGTISIMTFLNNAHPMILTSLETVVDFIERELELLDRNRYLDEMNEMILKQANTGYIVIDKDGKVVKVNPKAQAMIQSIKEEETLIQDLAPFNELYVLFSRGEAIRGNKVVLTNEEENLTCLVDYFPFPQGTLIQIHDISEYQKTECYIQNAEKLSIVGQLAAGVAHEIKNPLTTIKGFMQFIQEDQLDSRYLSVILKEIERINEITNEFLVLARPTERAKEWYDVKTLLQEMDVLLSSFTIQKNIEIVQDYMEIPRIYCDGNQLKQVFINIVMNSVEALEPNGNIHISVQKNSNNFILIRFVDNGCGFPKQILESVGKPFITTKENGNGLGIMICKRIVETIHSGTLNLYNNEQGGAVVEVLLPIGKD